MKQGRGPNKYKLNRANAARRADLIVGGHSVTCAERAGDEPDPSCAKCAEVVADHEEPQRLTREAQRLARIEVPR